ncbi:MAG: DUF2007 domain-containing protein [Actinobacteria bacterium]|nr:DUF2007 domain-containing protein [Actinomycetota bacterium]
MDFVENLKKIKTYSSRIEAEIAKSFLESHGIKSYIFSDDAGSMVPSQDFVTGVRLMVVKKDFGKTKEILDALEFITEEETE